MTPVDEQEIKWWAENRADDAGRLACCILAARAENDWRDISNAPWGKSVIVSDGEKVWLSSRHKGTKSSDGMPLDGHDWYLIDDHRYPTHWRQLPAPPAPVTK